MPVFRTCLVLLFCTATFAWSDELRTLSGKVIKGTVTGVSDKDVTLKTDQGPVVTPLADILALDLREITGVPAGTDYTEVRLLDNTVLRCSKFALKGKDAELTLLSGQNIKLELKHVFTYLKEAQKADLRKEWEALLSSRPKRDRLLFVGNDELKALECAVKEVDAKGETIDVRRDNNKEVSVPLANLQGLIFFRTEKPSEDIVCQVIDVQGNSLAATKIAVDGAKFSVTTAAGFKLTFDNKDVARFDYNLGKLSYLSDLALVKPPVRKSRAGVFDNFSEDIRKDVSLDGQPIMLDIPISKTEKASRYFAKGLTLRAYTELEYDLGGKYKKFKAILGVMPPAESEQAGIIKPRIIIECDGNKRFADFVTADKTVPLDIDVEGVTRLRITVSSSNLLDLYDNATLADAKVTQ